jgi:hypothetical protein
MVWGRTAWSARMWEVVHETILLRCCHGPNPRFSAVDFGQLRLILSSVEKRDQKLYRFGMIVRKVYDGLCCFLLNLVRSNT